MLTKEDRIAIEHAPHHYRDFWRWACPCGKGFTDMERYYAHQGHCFAWGHPERRQRNSLGGYKVSATAMPETNNGDNQFSVDGGESFWPHLPKAVGSDVFQVALHQKNGIERRAVPGQRVIIPGFEEFTFFLHADLYGGQLRVSEATTGNYVGEGTTKEKAIADATAHVTKLGKEYIRLLVSA